jgi:ubiquitin-protein ligase
MATSNPLKRLWKEYEKLKNWAASTDPAPTIFKVETSEDEIEMISSRPNNGGAAPAIQGEHISIVGLIYPSTAPFRQRGLRVEILVPAGYPQEPPVVYMRMRIRHPNIEKDGK